MLVLYQQWDKNNDLRKIYEVPMEDKVEGFKDDAVVKNKSVCHGRC